MIKSKLYKMIDLDDIKSDYSTTFEFFYGEKEKKRIDLINMDDSNGNYYKFDDDSEWLPNNDKLLLNVSFKMNNVKKLFGNKAFCYQDTILGIGLEWKAHDSRLKNCIKIGEFDKQNDNIVFKKENILINDVYSNISFKIIIYVVKPGTFDYYNYYGNKEGLILFSNTELNLLMKGNASMFPIEYIISPSGPLWDVVNDNVSLEDDFDLENIRIRINTAHKSFKYIDIKNIDNFNEDMFNDVVSSALTLMILSIKESCQVSSFEFDDDIERGTVAQALLYFRDTLNFKINNSATELANSIKVFLDKRGVL